MLAHWPNEPDSNPMAAHLNRTPKYVATRTLDKLTWNNAHVLDGDLTDAVNALKAEGDGYVTVLGSGELVQQLLAARLVDELQLLQHALVLGTGKKLFREYDEPLALRLVDVTPTPTGVLILKYATV
jgi:dihydrofolate reductase